jgi:murein DD-endopeptidase MepM/ murein hydrolase activator NlpD
MDRIAQIQNRINQIETAFQGPQQQAEGSQSFQQMLQQAQTQGTARIDANPLQQMTSPFMVPGMQMAPGVSPVAPGGPGPSGFVNPCPTGKLSPYAGDDGLDIHAPRGTPVYAAKDGVIVYNDPSGHSAWEGGGNDTGAIRIRHADGTESWYAHLSGRNEDLKPGMTIKAGQMIGNVGTANNVPHLHMSVFKSTGGDEGGFVDPFELEKMMKEAPTNVASQPMMNPQVYGQMYGMNQGMPGQTPFTSMNSSNITSMINNQMMNQSMSFNNENSGF